MSTPGGVHTIFGRLFLGNVYGLSGPVEHCRLLVVVSVACLLFVALFLISVWFCLDTSDYADNYYYFCIVDSALRTVKLRTAAGKRLCATLNIIEHGPKPRVHHVNVMIPLAQCLNLLAFTVIPLVKAPGGDLQIQSEKDRPGGGGHSL